MGKNEIFIIVIALILLVIIGTVVYFVISSKKKDNSVQVHQNSEKKEENDLTIHDMLNIAKNTRSTKNDLTKAVMLVAKKFKFPDKLGSNPTKEGVTYLNFISLVISNKSSDAKLIAFMNKELKKANPKYALEIDKYEQIGIASRSMKR